MVAVVFSSSETKQIVSYMSKTGMLFLPVFRTTAGKTTTNLRDWQSGEGSIEAVGDLLVRFVMTLSRRDEASRRIMSESECFEPSA